MVEGRVVTLEILIIVAPAQCKVLYVTNYIIEMPPMVKIKLWFDKYQNNIMLYSSHNSFAKDVHCTLFI